VKGKVKLHDEGVVGPGKNLPFSFHTENAVALQNSVFPYLFHGAYLVVLLVTSEKNFTERPLPHQL
jgi:hypothetical protein